MDRNTTNKIKGLAILSVLLSHGADMGCFNPISREWFGYACIGGMSCFFFLSGYGLYLSYKSKGLLNYWENKFKKIFFPYMICQIILFLVYFLKGYKYTFVEYLSMLTGVSRKNLVDGSMWYINFLLLLYWLFFICFSICNETVAIVLLTVISLVSYKYIPIYFHPDYISIQFVGGVFCAKIGKVLPNNRCIKYIIFGSATLMGIILMNKYYGYNNSIEYIYKLIAALLIMIAMILFIDIIPYKVKLLAKLGDNSLYIFLVEWNFIYNGYFIYNRIGANTISFIILFALILITSYLLKIVVEKVGEYILRGI